MLLFAAAQKSNLSLTVSVPPLPTPPFQLPLTSQSDFPAVSNNLSSEVDQQKNTTPPPSASSGDPTGQEVYVFSVNL